MSWKVSDPIGRINKNISEHITKKAEHLDSGNTDQLFTFQRTNFCISKMVYLDIMIFKVTSSFKEGL